jgi:hypothetical protein
VCQFELDARFFFSFGNEPLKPATIKRTISHQFFSPPQMMTSHLSMVKLCLLFACFLLFTSEATAMHGYHSDDTDMMAMEQMPDMDNAIGLYKRNRELFCGRYLIQRLQVVCKGIYNNYNKRRAPDTGLCSHKARLEIFGEIQLPRYFSLDFIHS